jgi:hypothetical protein
MLETVASFTEPWEAHMFRHRLETEGIPAFVSFQCHVGNNWPIGLGLGGAKVQVPRSLHEGALVVWQDCQAGIFCAELEAEVGAIGRFCCPQCGAVDFRKHRSLIASAVAIAVVLVFGLCIPPVTWIYRCRNCGTRWKTD